MRLITGHGGAYHVSLDAVEEFERCILKDERVEATPCDTSVAAKSAFYAWQAQRRLGVGPWGRGRQPAGAGPSVRDPCLAVLMGPNFRKCFPFFVKSDCKNLYLFDAWPSSHTLIKQFVEDFGVERVFVSSSQACERLRQLLGVAKVHWIPEGIDATEYRFVPELAKDIDVLSLGRKHDRLHQKIVEPLKLAGTTYLYETVKGQIVFPTRSAFIDGLARTKISICIPSSVTHPERAEGISTMTLRYLQSMVSKCLLLGHAPAEMIELFGYNPVVEIDENDPAGQILSLLADFEGQQPMIERNYDTVVAHHTWKQRWQQLQSFLHAPDLQPAH